MIKIFSLLSFLLSIVVFVFLSKEYYFLALFIYSCLHQKHRKECKV
jgi:hypothetical protein